VALRARIVIVEDSGIVAMDLQERLQRLGYAVAGVAASGEQAMALVEETAPDLILMDIVLEGAMSGVEVAEKLRQQHRAPVVYVTAHADPLTLDRAKLTGPFGYVLKPFEDRELHASIEMALFRHDLESKLRESERLLAATLRSIGDGVIATDAQGLVTFMNPVAEQLTGWAESHVLGWDCNEVFQVVLGDARLLAESPVSRALREGAVAALAPDATLVAREGRETWIDGRAAPIRDESGAVAGSVLVFRDVTERKRAEATLRERDEQLRQAQRMEALGRLAGGVAHDFNNLLMVIVGRSQLLLERMGEADPLREDIDEIRRAGEQGAALTAQLQASTRRQLARPKLIELNGLVADTERMLRRLIGEDVTLATELQPGLGHVRCDPAQVRQVLMNVAVLARDAMPRGGKLAIETSDVDVEPGAEQQALGVRPGAHVQLTVTATPGEGINGHEAAAGRDHARPTGFGVATIQGIAAQAGGGARVRLLPTGATAFEVFFPLHAGPAPAPRPTLPAPSRADQRTILIVEDQDGGRRLMADILRGSGHDVLEARHGAEALDVARRHDGAIDLVVTDLVMPRLSGDELARRLVELRPQIKVLFVSGYAPDARVSESGAPLLRKPFRPDELAQRVRELLQA
jgi:hypothetical protein